MTRKRKDKRRRAREAALQILYQWEIGGADVPRAVDTFFGLQWPDEEPPDDELRAFATRLANDTVARLAEVDPLIAETAKRWRPERMAVLDRLVLRMAVCEMLRDPGTPRPAIINEAIEIARTFGTDDSAKFINGMLDAIKRKIETR